jgi:hypothetical protein
MTAASILERPGRTDFVAVDGGPSDWADAHHTSLVTGSAPQ